ncbi:MAG: sulfatase-like hydrolase/transferase [Planctomycetota bacterium]
MSLVLIALASAVPVLVPGPAAAAEPKPNILFIMVDDLGKEWISCYGGQEMKTPQIDKLAAGGMRFNNAYSMPQCTPTRATLLTGQYPWRNGWCNHWDVPRWGAGCHFDWRHNLTFARVMQSAGYVCAAAGKWQINDFRVQPEAMQKHGFDEWCMWTGFESQNPPSAKRYWDPYIHTNEGSKTHQGRFGTDVFVDFLVDFMTRHKERPMMLYFPMALTHGPLVPTPLDPGVEDKIGRHKAMVRYTDHAVGRLVAALEDLKIRQRTIVIFSTDNGSAGGISARMGGRLVRGGKGSLGEPGPCGPFIVNCPGLVPEGVVTDALADFTDLLPTFAELGGAELPRDAVIDGVSFAKLILGKADDSPREWIMALGHGAARLDAEGVRPKQDFTDRVVRDKRYKLWVLNGESAKLFDLLNDPAEQNDLIDSSHPKVIAARKRLEAVVQSCPTQDARPRYDPTPPQPWDKKPGAKKKRREKRRRSAKPV